MILAQGPGTRAGWIAPLTVVTVRADPAAGTVARGTEVGIAVPGALAPTGVAEGSMLAGERGDKAGDGAGWVAPGDDTGDSA